MKSSVIFTAEGRMNTKNERARDSKAEALKTKLPPSYLDNDTKEELTLTYIQSFLDQFTAQNPKRQRPYLVAENEYGVRKFVCTTIRPTEIAFSELYDMYECSSFLAGFILYEPLDPPMKPPRVLFSPTETMKQHTGDSFDIAVLLCSLMIGAGYDAYVVCGYAPRHITLRDQSNTACPMVATLNDNFTKSVKIKADDDAEPHTSEGVNPYHPPDNTTKSSHFITEQNEKSRAAGVDTFELWIPDRAAPLPHGSVGDPTDDDYVDDHLRQHAWVMVSGGRRDVRETVFLEPSTGRAYVPSNSPYFGVESVWNHENFWVLNSSQMKKKVSEIDFDLSTTSVWECLFPPDTKKNTRRGSRMAMAKNQSLDGEGDGDGEGDDMGMSEEKSPGKPGTPGAAAGALGFGFKDTGRAFDPPVSWVTPIVLERTRFLLRYPPLGRRTIQYHSAKADFFARNTQIQGMVMRITLYLDTARTIVKETHEWYENRKDKMYKRIRYYIGSRKFVEFFHPGSSGEVRQWSEHPGKRMEVDFYVDGRLDRMVRREEVVGEKVSEYFEGRSDHLRFRSVLFTVDRLQVGSRQFPLPGAGLASELFVLRMTQKFDEDKSVGAGVSVASKVFYVREGKVVISHHFASMQVTAEVKTYIHTRGQGVPVMTELAYAQEEGVVEDADGLQEAAAMERECYTSVKNSYQEMQKIVDSRASSERTVANEKSVFEIAYDKADKMVGHADGRQDGDKDKDTKGLNYLTPYLRIVKDPKNVSRVEALEVRQNCLDALRARLVERANIIQSRLNDENAKLAREQERFQRSQREGDLSTEEYEKYCTEAMFRIQILEQRLAAHEEAALKKFAELDAKLAQDDRLKVLKA